MAQITNLTYYNSIHNYELPNPNYVNFDPLEQCVVSLFPQYSGIFLYGPNQTYSPENNTQDSTYRNITGLNNNTILGSDINKFLWTGVKFYSDNSPFHSGDVVGDSLPRPYGQNGNGPRYSALSRDIVVTALHFVNFSGFKGILNGGTIYFWHNGQLISRTIKALITFQANQINNSTTGITVISKAPGAGPDDYVYTDYTDEMLQSFPPEYGVTYQNLYDKVSPFTDCIMLVLNEKLPVDFITPYLFENTTAHDFASFAYDLLGEPSSYEVAPDTSELFCPKMWVDQNNFIRNTYSGGLMQYFQSIFNTPTSDYTGNEIIQLFNSFSNFGFDGLDTLDENEKIKAYLSLFADSAVNHDSSSPVFYYAPVLSKPIFVNFLTSAGDIIGGYGEKLGTNQGLPLIGASISGSGVGNIEILPNTTEIFYSFLSQYLGTSMPDILKETNEEYLNFKAYTKNLSDTFHNTLKKSISSKKDITLLCTNLTVNSSFDSFAVSDFVLSPSTFHKSVDTALSASSLYNKLNVYSFYYQGFPFGVIDNKYSNAANASYSNIIDLNSLKNYYRKYENLNKPNTIKNYIINKTNYMCFNLNVMPLLGQYFSSPYGYSNIIYTTASSFHTFSLSNKSFYNFLNNNHIADKGNYYYRVTIYKNDQDEPISSSKKSKKITAVLGSFQITALLKYLTTLSYDERNNKIFDIFRQYLDTTDEFGEGVIEYKKIDAYTITSLQYMNYIYTGDLSSIKFKIEILKQNNTVDYTWYFNFILTPNTNQNFSSLYVSSFEETDKIKNKYYVNGTTQTYSDVIYVPIPCDNNPNTNVLLGDYNRDGIINGSDLSTLLSSWNTVNYEVDLDGDGFVGGSDLAILLSQWGKTLQNPAECETNFTEYAKTISFTDLNYNNPVEVNKFLIYPNQTSESINNIIRN